jgi:hypothetical protein
MTTIVMIGRGISVIRYAARGCTLFFFVMVRVTFLRMFGCTTRLPRMREAFIATARCGTMETITCAAVVLLTTVTTVTTVIMVTMVVAIISVIAIIVFVIIMVMTVMMGC